MTAVQILTHNMRETLNATLHDVLCDDRIVEDVLNCILKSMEEYKTQECIEFVTKHFGQNPVLINRITNHEDKH